MDQKLIQILIQAKDDASATMAAVGGQLDSLNDKQRDMINTAAKATAVVGALGGVALAGVAAYGLYAAGSMQQASIGMTNLLGNAQEANKVFGQLAVYANNTPFTFADIRTAAQTLLGFGYGGQQAVDMIKQMGDIAAASGGKIGDLALVTGQIFAQGKLRAQDLYQVINDGGAGVVKIMAANAGGMQKLTDEFNTGGIPAQQYFNAINQATAQGGFAFQGAQNQAQTFTGRISTLQDAFTQLAEKLVGVSVTAQGLTIDPNGLFEKASNAILGLINALNGFPDWWAKNKGTIEIIGGAIAGGLLALAAALIVVNAEAIALAISAALAMAPFIIIGVVVGAAAIAIITHWTQVKEFFANVWNSTMDLFRSKWGLAIAAIMPFIGIPLLIIANWSKITGALRDVVNTFALLFTGNYTHGMFGQFVQEDSKYVDVILNIRNTIKTTWQDIVSFIETSIQDIILALKAIIAPFIAVWTYIFDVIRGVWIVAWNFLWANVVKPTIDQIVGYIQTIATVAVIVWNVIAAAAKIAWDFLWTVVIKPQIDQIVEAFNFLVGIGTWTWAQISSAASAAFQFMSGIFNALISPAHAAGSAAGSAFSDAFTAVVGAIKFVINGMISDIDTIIHAVNATAGKLPGVPKIGDIPHFDAGGWVPGAPGQPQLAVVHGGEYVMSRGMLNRSGGATAAPGGNHYEVHIHTPAVLGSQRDLADYVYKGLMQIDRASGTPQLPNIGVRP